MPEGHVIHRYARLHRKALARRPVSASSPQGRFADGAARIDGASLKSARAAGKHLFYRWSNGEILHIHLGLIGKFLQFEGAAPAPTPGTRLALEAGDVTIYLAGATVCRLIDPLEEEEIRGRLGPDPLDRRADPQRFIEALSRRTVPIGAALLDQKAMAGVGNVFRAEILFLARINPMHPANELEASEKRQLWDLAVTELRRAEPAGRIITVDPVDVGAKIRGRLQPDKRLYVYKRATFPCRRCGTEIATAELAGRSIWWCPSCQP